jgi:hypothetical protein
MAEDDIGSVLLDGVPKLLDGITDMLSGVGIELPPMASQSTLLALVAVPAYVLGRRQLKNKEHMPLPALLGLTGFALVALGILVSWASQLVWPLPEQVSGFVNAHPVPADLRVQLLDFRGDKISLSRGLVDSVDGRFVLDYKRSLGDRPRAIALSAPGCSTVEQKLSRAQLRSGQDLELDFSCAPSKS